MSSTASTTGRLPGRALRLLPLRRPADALSDADQSYTVSDRRADQGPSLLDTDSNIWTDPAKGERYIRALAKRQILRRRDPRHRQGAGPGQYAQRYRQELFEQTHSRIATNEMAAYA
jgi:hypothetical protein